MQGFSGMVTKFEGLVEPDLHSFSMQMEVGDSLSERLDRKRYPCSRLV